MAAVLADDIFKCIFLNEKVWSLIKILLEFVQNGLNDNNRIGDKPLSEPMMTQFSDAYMRH